MRLSCPCSSHHHIPLATCNTWRLIFSFPTTCSQASRKCQGDERREPASFHYYFVWAVMPVWEKEIIFSGVTDVCALFTSWYIWTWLEMIHGLKIQQADSFSTRWLQPDPPFSEYCVIKSGSSLLFVKQNGNADIWKQSWENREALGAAHFKTCSGCFHSHGVLTFLIISKKRPHIHTHPNLVIWIPWPSLMVTIH